MSVTTNGAAHPLVGTAEYRAPSATQALSAAPRDRYIDSLRAVALFRVVLYHLFGWAWLSVIFPSMPIMFALGGSLVAASLDRSPLNPWRVLGKRIRRLLPPLWALGAVAIPLMLDYGWTYDAELFIGSPLDWRTLLFWIVPISDPPGSAWGVDWTVGLWYIRTYLWLLVLSPALLWLYRRWPRRTLAVPLLGLLLPAVGLWDLSSATGDVLHKLLEFGTCWLLGFAHHDNKIRPIALRKVIPAALTLMAVGLGYALTHQDPTTGYDLDNLPLANALWGTGAVLLLLRCYPDFSWLSRFPVLDKTVTAINNRAMTIYLWNNPAIFLAIPISDALATTQGWDTEGVTGGVVRLTLTLGLIVAAILIFGVVEDLAAGRRPRINPWPARPGPRRNVPSEVAQTPAQTSPARRSSWWRKGSPAIATLVVLLFLYAMGSMAWPGAPASSTQTAVDSQGGAETGVPAPSSSGSPDRVVSGYWQGWGNPALRLRDVPEQYNVINVAFAVGDPTGKVTFSQSVQSKASFISDVDALNQSGRPVVLSVGGADDGGLKITNEAQRQAFVASVTDLIDTYHFSGIDWDLEHGFNPEQIAAATHELKARYGPWFVVTMAPLVNSDYEAQQLDLANRIKDVLDFVAPQFYNMGEVGDDEEAYILARAKAWGDVVGPHKVVLGFMTVKTKSDTGIRSPKSVCAIWEQVQETSPGTRGVMTWSINLDKASGNAFSRTCGREVRDGLS